MKQIPTKDEILKVISEQKLLYKCCNYFNCNVGTLKGWLKYYEIDVDFSKNSVLPEILEQRGNTKKERKQKTILRFWEHDIYNHLEDCITKIKNQL